MKNSKLESCLYECQEMFTSFLTNEEGCIDAKTLQETCVMFGLNYSVEECEEMQKYPVDFGGKIDQKDFNRVLSMTIVYF